MITQTLIWDKFYGGLIPGEYWNYKMQEEWAKEATEFYLAFNRLKIIDINAIAQPYVFTRKDIADCLDSWLGFHAKDFNIAPNHDGGMLAIYMGTENSIILTVELKKDYTLVVEYMHGGISSKTTYAYSVDSEYKEKEIQRIFTRLFYEWV